LALFYLYVVVAGKKAIKRFGDPMLVSQLTPEVSRKRERLKFWLLFTSIAVTVFMIAGPQFGSKLETVKRQGVEIMICLDVSNSMMAEDIQPNRLEKAKQSGARALFGEKYEDKVKVYSIGDFSKEVCGGPHVEHTGTIGTFKIQKEQSSSAGVRRIRAVIA